MVVAVCRSHPALTHRRRVSSTFSLLIDAAHLYSYAMKPDSNRAGVVSCGFGAG